MRIFKGQPRSVTPASVEPRPCGEVFTDVHCHCLPDLDDGPADRAEAVALCRALVADGIRTVVATPHQLGRYAGRYGGCRIRRAVAELSTTLAEAGVPLTVLAGADVRIDERIPDLLESGDVLAVGEARRYLLLELPHEVFVDPHTLLARLAEKGIVAVITHPERHPFLARNPAYVQRWAEYRPCLQITAASFGGGFGRLSQEAAWAFLHAPLPILAATDAHGATSRPPRMTQAYTLLRQRWGRAAARRICVENPQRVVQGQDLAMSAPRGVPGEVRR